MFFSGRFSWEISFPGRSVFLGSVFLGDQFSWDQFSWEISFPGRFSWEIFLGDFLGRFSWEIFLGDFPGRFSSFYFKISYSINGSQDPLVNSI
jgi:hypothetical protein